MVGVVWERARQTSPGVRGGGTEVRPHQQVPLYAHNSFYVFVIYFDFFTSSRVRVIRSIVIDTKCQTIDPCTIYPPPSKPRKIYTVKLPYGGLHERPVQ